MLTHFLRHNLWDTQKLTQQLMLKVMMLQQKLLLFL